MCLAPLGILFMVGSVDDHQVAFATETVNDHVIHYAALVVAHGAVAGLAAGHHGVVVGQQMVQDKLDGIIEDMKVETTDEYDKITAYNVNTYLPFNADAFVSNGSGSAGSAVGSAG